MSRHILAYLCVFFNRGPHCELQMLNIQAFAWLVEMLASNQVVSNAVSFCVPQIQRVMGHHGTLGAYVVGPPKFKHLQIAYQVVQAKLFFEFLSCGCA